MASRYYDEFSGFNIDRALIDFNGDIVEVSSYANQEGERADFLKAYREKVKQWMKYNHKNMKWLASQIGMSEGSTKNLLYTNLNITPEKLAAIQKAMDEGLEGAESSDLTWLVMDLDGDLYKLADFASWCMAVEIPLSCLSEVDLNCVSPSPEYRGVASVENARKLAEWATPALMKEAASVLRPFYEQNRDSLFQIAKTDARTALIVREVPAGRRTGNTVDIVRSSYDYNFEHSVEIQLPAIHGECQPLYIELAASLKNMSIGEWVITTLNKEAKTKGLANLADFISSTLD